MEEIKLKYGCNPQQSGAQVSAETLPITVLNGNVGYINLLDALNGWQLVRELKQATGLPAAASFKHVSPAGAAVGLPLSDVLRQIYFVGDIELSPLAAAYARARGADRVSSFGDWIALSDTVDESTARLIKREVSDGVIAPAYDAAALKILSAKKGGEYRILQVDPDFEPPTVEKRDVFGIAFEQERNLVVPTIADLQNIVTENKTLPASAQRDMLVALVALKYTQSNSVCFAYDGQTIGVGAGQQSRIHCTRLAAGKAENWFLRQHERVLGLDFRPTREGRKLPRPARDNAIDQFLLPYLPAVEEAMWRENFSIVPTRFTEEEKRDYLAAISGATLGSDAFFPFRDSIDRAQMSGVSYVVQPGGSLRDDGVTQACDDYGIVMAHTGVRLFHH